MTFIILQLFILDSKISIFIFSVYYHNNLLLFTKNKKNKLKPLVVTKRIRRLYVTILFLFNSNCNNCLTFKFLSYLLLFNNCSISIFKLFVIMVANIFNKPFEKHVYHYYRIKAMKKLKNMPHLKYWYYWKLW